MRILNERLQAVISALTSGKFYWLPPDKENPARDSDLKSKGKLGLKIFLLFSRSTGHIIVCSRFS